MTKERAIIGIQYYNDQIEIIHSDENNHFNRMKEVLSHYDMEKTILLLRGGDCYYIMPSLNDNKLFKDDPDSDPTEDISIKLVTIEDLFLFFKQSICQHLYLLDENTESWRYLHKDNLTLNSEEQKWEIFM